MTLPEFIYPLISNVITMAVTWFLARRKNNAEAKIAEIDSEIKAADLYKSLFNDLKLRLEEAISTIEEQNKRLKERDLLIAEADKRIAALTDEVENLVHELKKYKQLSGKS